MLFMVLFKTPCLYFDLYIVPCIYTEIFSKNVLINKIRDKNIKIYIMKLYITFLCFDFLIYGFCNYKRYKGNEKIFAIMKQLVIYKILLKICHYEQINDVFGTIIIFKEFFVFLFFRNQFNSSFGRSYRAKLSLAKFQKILESIAKLQNWNTMYDSCRKTHCRSIEKN